MSEQLPPLVSHDSLRIITVAAQVGEISSDVLSFLSASAEYHLLDVINDASTFRSRGKRSRLTVDDVNAALELRGAESSLVFSGGLAGLREDGSTEEEGSGAVLGADSKVDLRKVANASLPVCPIEPGFDMHWLAVDGQQPLLPQNPIPSAARGKSKGSKRSRASSKQAGGEGEGGTSAVQARLSEELTTYLRRCCEAVLSRDEAKRSRALASLRNDPGLQQLLPHLCTFIQTKVMEYLKRKKDPNQLAALLQMLQCLLNNSHFAFLEIYLDRLLPPVMSCLLHQDFTPRGVTAESDDADWRSSSVGTKTPSSVVVSTKWNHWKVRNYAAELLRAICDKHGHTYPTLQARASDMFCTQAGRSKTPLTTLYGAIKGLACLGPSTVEQTLWPRADSLTRRISEACEASVAKRDSVGVNEANQCVLALLQAVGSATISNTSQLFGNSHRRTVKKATPETKAVANLSNSSNGVASLEVVRVSARRREQLSKRLDRSLYSRGGSSKSPATNKEDKAGSGIIVDNSPAGKEMRAALAMGGGSEKGAAEAAEAVVVRDKGTEGDGGGSALDEGVFPWYVVGLKNNGAAPQARWLISRHSLFV